MEMEREVMERGRWEGHGEREMGRMRYTWGGGEKDTERCRSGEQEQERDGKRYAPLLHTTRYSWAYIYMNLPKYTNIRLGRCVKVLQHIRCYLPMSPNSHE